MLQESQENLLNDSQFIITSNAGNDLDRISWFPAVRDTGPLARHGAVFDYKWLGWKDEELRGHAVAMLFWDGLIAATLFHDPSCECHVCQERRNTPGGIKV